MKYNNPHCCTAMSEFLQDNRIPIEYDPQLREYGIKLSARGVRQLILYCPWCGSRLPDSLRDAYFNILEHEYKIDDPWGWDKPQIPEEFKTDEWWKKRGL